MFNVKLLLGSAVVIFGGLFAYSAFAAPLQQVADSTYRLTHNDRFVCSAVAISPTQLVTAAHCIPEAIPSRKGLSIKIHEEINHEIVKTTDLKVDVIRTNYPEDTAFLEVKTDTLRFTDMASNVDLELGSPMFAVGYPRGGELTLTEGMFTATANLKEMGLDAVFWKNTIPVTGGSSGGGIYVKEWDVIAKDWDYKLVGLATATYRDVSFQTYSSTLESIKKVVKGLIKADE